MLDKHLPLFQPIKLGNMVLKNRIAMGPMGENFGGKIGERSIKYYARRAKGGVGMVITGAYTSTKLYHTVLSNLLDDDNRTNLALLADAVHAGGAKLCIEFTAGTGRNMPDIVTGECHSSSDSTWFYDPSRRCIPITKEEIKTIMDDTLTSAANCLSAGVDCINIHAHNGYLIDQFISSGWNHRTDEYGGSVENRMRFLLEYIDAIRSAVGPSFPIIVRITIDPEFPGIREDGETEQMLKILAKAPINALDVDCGIYESSDKIFPPYYLGDATEIRVADLVRSWGIDLPLLNAGNLTPDIAADAIKSGRIDIASFARQMLADPDMPNKLLEGKPEEIRPCIKCNMGCLTRTLVRGQSCAVNAEVGIEERTSMVRPCRKQKVVVIGSGVAGLEAARVSAQRGADVVLIEKGPRLGGTARDIATPSWKYRFRQLFDWFELQMKELGVKVLLNTEATADCEGLKDTDRIFVATGSNPIIPKIEGIDGENVVNVLDVHRNEALAKGDRIAICGGGLSGCELALELAEAGKKVTVIEMRDSFAVDAAAFMGMVLFRKLNELGVEMLANTTVKSFNAGGVVVENNGAERLIEADTCIHAFGLRPNDALGLELMAKYPGRVQIIGDADKVNCIFDGIHAGYNAGCSLA